MSNALQRDLQALVTRIQDLDAPRVAADCARQRYHLQPPVGWLNDPNGLCRFDGYYHVFYQYSPFDANGGVKHWAHTRSKDLLHWEQLPTALYPDETFDLHGAYSGSALVEDGVLYLYYTGNVKHPGNHDYIHTGRGHNTCLAISHDGVQFEKQCLLQNADYPAGLTCHVRDPKVWRQDGRYYMVQGARRSDDVGVVLVFVSDDKLHWQHCNTITTPQKFGYMWECPDLFELNGQWFLAVSPQGLTRRGDDFQNIYSCGYFPLYGDFRGEYTLGEYRELDHGFDFYAPQTFDDEQGRRLLFGWLGMPDADYRNPTVAYGWQHCLSVPCVLTAQGETLLRTPAPELDALHSSELRAPAAPGLTLNGGCFDLHYTPAGPDAALDLRLRGSARLQYRDGVLSLHLPQGGYGRDQRRAVLPKLHNLRVLGDASSLEIFANDGATVLSTRYYPTAADCQLCFDNANGDVALYGMEAPQT